MQSVTQEISGNRRHQGEQGREQELRLAFSGGSQRLKLAGALKALDAHSSAVGGGSAVVVRGVGGSYTSALIDIQALNFGVMNAPTWATRGGSGPCAHREFFGFDSQRPTRIRLDHIIPTDSELFQGISYNDSLIAEEDLGTNQKDVNTNYYSQGDERAGNLADTATLVEARPDKKSAQHQTDTGKDHIGSGTKNIGIVHSTILSHQFSKVGDSVKAVR